jgi:2-dehydro-3-deoxygalactonokinase
MMQKAVIAAIDWGTSSFRFWLLDQAGLPLAEVRSDQGMASLRPEDYGPVLEEALNKSSAPLNMPVLICGMAGSAQGWQSAPYVDLPANLSKLHEAACKIDDIDRDVRILPGLAQRMPERPDVMRGEETLLLGATLAQGVEERTVCLPGTHSKWAQISEGEVKGFGTSMTGEIFSLLANSSTLSHFTEVHQEVAKDPHFIEAVAEGLSSPGDLMQKLFSVRAGPLLFGQQVAQGATARLSGLLIGTEIAAFGKKHEEILLVAAGKLSEAYATALGVAGIKFEQIDAEALIRAGLTHAASSIWPDRFPQ